MYTKWVLFVFASIFVCITHLRKEIILLNNGVIWSYSERNAFVFVD